MVPSFPPLIAGRDRIRILVEEVCYPLSGFWRQFIDVLHDWLNVLRPFCLEEKFKRIEDLLLWKPAR